LSRLNSDDVKSARQLRRRGVVTQVELRGAQQPLLFAPVYRRGR
jgi:hypothetical protein